MREKKKLLAHTLTCMAPVTDKMSFCVSCGGEGLDGGLGGGVGRSSLVLGIGEACGEGVATSFGPTVINSSGSGMSSSNKSSTTVGAVE